MAEQTAADICPSSDRTFYGRAVWPLGEDGDMGTMVEGHGLRALAALNAHQRDADGREWRVDGRHLMRLEVRELWVVFHETCGHTVEQHAEHFADDDYLECECEHPGLPPCEPERFAWTYDRVPEGTRGALAMTEVTW